MKIYKIVLGTHVFLPASTLINHTKIHIYFKIKTLKMKPVHRMSYQGMVRNLLGKKNKTWSRKENFQLGFIIS